MGNGFSRDAICTELSDSPCQHPPINGAIDALYVDQQDGSFKCTGLYLSISRFSCVRYCGRDSPVKVRINGSEIPGLSINLSRISRQNGKDEQGVPSSKLTDEENGMIFRQLRHGRNKITFYIKGHPNSEVDARVYRWKLDTKVVVVDIDGTVTRSKLRGLYFCYTQEHYLRKDVSYFLLYLKALGYQLIYLTARPISSIGLSRNYLADDFHQFWKLEGTKLPDGPVFTSCDGRLRCARNFLQDKAGLGGISHYDFKARSLENVRDLFGTFDFNPDLFVAGFGDTLDDALSYRAVGIPGDRIFNIAKRGNITTSSGRKFKSYGDLLLFCRANGTFPPVGHISGYDDFFGLIHDRAEWINWILHHMPPGYHELS